MKTSHRTLHQNINAKQSEVKSIGSVTPERLKLNAAKFNSEKSKGL